MIKREDLTRLRTQSDIKIAKANLRYSSVIQERVISESFRKFGEFFITSVKMAALQAGTGMLTAALIRLLKSRSG